MRRKDERLEKPHCRGSPALRDLYGPEDALREQCASGLNIIKGGVGVLLEKPRKVILAEACEGGDFFQGERLRIMLVDIVADKEKFLHIFLLFVVFTSKLCWVISA